MLHKAWRSRAHRRLGFVVQVGQAARSAQRHIGPLRPVQPLPLQVQLRPQRALHTRPVSSAPCDVMLTQDLQEADRDSTCYPEHGA
jgi:hypothetical protein